MTYHPHTNGQSEMVNYKNSLGDLLWYLVGEHLTTCDTILLEAELVYNS